MEILKENRKSIFGCCATILTGVMVSGLAGPITVAALGGLFSGVAGNFLTEHFKDLYSGVNKNIFREHPDKLNHDLLKTMAVALKKAVKNVEQLYYERHDIEKEQRRVIDAFIKNLQDFSLLYINATADPKNSDALLKEYLLSDPDIAKHNLHNLLSFEIVQHRLPESFVSFFEDNIAGQLTLCFGEEIKDPKNNKAWVAFQKMMLTDIKTDTEKILEAQKRLEEGIEVLKKQRTPEKLIRLSPKNKEAFTALLKEINKPQKILAAFDNALEQQLSEINKKLTGIELQLKKHYEINTRNTEIIRTKLLGKPLVIMAIIAILSSVAVGLIYYYYQQQPFGITIAVHGPKGPGDLVLAGKCYIILHYGDRNEEELLNEKEEAYFKHVPGKYNGDSATVTIKGLEGEPYVPVCPGCKYKFEKEQTIYVRLEAKGLDKLPGVVMDEINNMPIPGATVRVQDILDTTDENGNFLIMIPPEKQRRLQNITVMKDGYEPGGQSKVPPHLAIKQAIEIHLKKHLK